MLLQLVIGLEKNSAILRVFNSRKILMNQNPLRFMIDKGICGMGWVKLIKNKY